MTIEYFLLSTGEALSAYDARDFFLMNDEVFQDNQYYCESQEATVSFEDFIERRADVGWRILPSAKQVQTV